MAHASPRHSDARVLEAWRENAAPWTQTVRAQAIESRRLVTDRAVVDAALRLAPRSVLDLGCGEGWLSRALCLHGIEVHGVDAIPDLIDAARRLQGDADAVQPRYDCLSYEAIAEGALCARYDLAICNFSLLGDDSVAGLLGAMPALLNPRGHVLIQTLHPPQACGEAPYLDGWRDGSWAGCDAAFGEPAPWYFRTIGGWVALLERSGLRLRELAEPVHPVSGRPVSLMLIAEAG
ncbi:MAG: methyltransferase domain-containing protein [Lysobacter sp.]|nr:methyltransferase domain-containing protein [Lysobacter sp.]